MFTVLGASGFIGRPLVESLAAQGHEVHAPGRDMATVFDRPLGHVLYCIGLTADFRTKPFETARAHVSVLADVLEHAEFESLVYLSSTRVYARSSTGSESTEIVVDVSDPSDFYNATKLAGESLCRASGRAGAKVARLSNVTEYDGDSGNFLSSMIQDALRGSIELRSHPRSSKDYIMLADVVRLLPQIAVSGGDWLYNVANGTNVLHQDLLDRLAALTGCTTSLAPDAPLIEFPVIDVTRIRREFGYAPAGVLDALPALVEKYRLAANA